ncbi:MAG: hypothetical protein HPM95_08635 [Alphaproteobacteria bacterium]|nr:hypothetical protein [Alphaproteobacteria bacterium]
MQHYTRQAPGARVYVACGSMGGALCWRLAKDSAASAMMGGILLMGSTWDEVPFERHLPHRPAADLFRARQLGRVYDWKKQAGFFRAAQGAQSALSRASPCSRQAPTERRSATDWRLVLNWMFAATGR